MSEREDVLHAEQLSLFPLVILHSVKEASFATGIVTNLKTEQDEPELLKTQSASSRASAC